VNQVMGRGIMALFGAAGAPRTTRSAPCYAALRSSGGSTFYADELHAGAGPPCRSAWAQLGRGGVRAIGSDLTMDTPPSGRRPSRARMEQMGQAGSRLSPPHAEAGPKGTSG